MGSASAWAQSNAQINGTVRDSSGSAVADATIKVTQTATGAVRTVNSGPDGSPHGLEMTFVCVF